MRIKEDEVLMSETKTGEKQQEITRDDMIISQELSTDGHNPSWVNEA